MRKTVLLSLFLLCAVWAFAQTSSTPSQTTPSQTTSTTSSTTSSQTSTSTGKETKVEGCLNGSGGNYTLTDSAGKTWQLSGDTSKLAEHVGHKIEVKGTTSPASSTSGTAGAAGASTGSNDTLNLTSMKMVSPTCTASK